MMKRTLLMAGLVCLTLQPVTIHAMAVATVNDVLANGITPATAAAGAFDGNDTGAMGTLLGKLNDDGVFDAFVGNLNWQLVGKSNDGGNGPFTSNPEVTSGTLTFDSPIDGPFVLSIKASNSYSAYLFDDSFGNVAFVDFVTSGVSVNRREMPQDLSHASLWAPTDNPAVPEPAGILVWGGLVLAIGGVKVSSLLSRRLFKRG